MSRRRREPGGFSPQMAAGRGQVSVCVCASLRGRRASSPWRVAQGAGAKGRGRRSFPSPPGSARPPRPASRPAAPTSPPPLGSAGRRWRNNAQRLRRGRQYGGHTGAPRSAAPRGAESGAERLQRRLPGSARPPGRTADPLPGWRRVPPRSARPLAPPRPCEQARSEGYGSKVLNAAVFRYQGVLGTPFWLFPAEGRIPGGRRAFASSHLSRRASSPRKARRGNWEWHPDLKKNIRKKNQWDVEGKKKTFKNRKQLAKKRKGEKTQNHNANKSQVPLHVVHEYYNLNLTPKSLQTQQQALLFHHTGHIPR